MSSTATKLSQYMVLLGAPNTGKTTLFNYLTQSHYQTMNYPGSTVSFESGKLIKHPHVTVVDLPGIRSLQPTSEDEKIALKALTEFKTLIPQANPFPDLILFMVDETQRSRHLRLGKQLIEAGYPLIIVLNMHDIAIKKRKQLNTTTLSKKMGCPVLSMNARDTSDLNRLTTLCLVTLDQSPKIDPNTLNLQETQSTITEDYEHIDQLIEDHQEKTPVSLPSFDCDSVFLHPIVGPLSFVVIMSFFFYSIFSLAAPFSDMIDLLFSSLSSLTLTFFPQHWISEIFSQGILTGLGAIFVFVPQIFILFLGLGLLESTGYLSRAAMIIDRPLSLIGLNGRCFVPLLSGCACAIPALLATRNIEQKKQRLLCQFIIPLMQCSARLPVYGLLLALLFQDRLWLSGIGLTCIYLGSLVFTSVIAALGARFLGITRKNTSFHLELPEWKMPVFKHLFFQAYHQTKGFITNAGPLIILIAICLWTLSHFPSEQHSWAMSMGQFIEPIFSPMGVDWRVGVALLLSFAAREIFVSTLVILFSVQSDAPGLLLSSLQTAVFHNTNEPIFTIPVIIGMIVFFMISLQCGATVAVAKQEMKSWKGPLLQFGLYISLGYILAVACVQFLSFF